MRNLTINAERLWREPMDTAAIGATSNGGICRLTLQYAPRKLPLHAVISETAFERMTKFSQAYALQSIPPLKAALSDEARC
jgi:hypothetical protein